MFFHFPPSKNSTQKQYLQRDCLTFHEQQKLFVCFLFLQENTSRKFLIFLLSYLPVFYCKYRLHLLSFSLIVLAFPACTCEPVGIQHSFEFFCLVSGQGVQVWLESYLHTATQVPMFSPFSLLLFLFSFLHYHTCMLFQFPQRVPADLEVGYEKSILTRMNKTETFLLLFISKNPCYL